ncbi:ras-related protein rab-32-like [Plasmopara halstedii]|uniref:Ras-related protein Rab n=1 Tax=Plasmopara halstedii TaxID=4781 RepID=A0A0P1A3Y3_PLAHL|nr:ras-related protein rab-32-like [Plasmopara halstedii]CEG35098.1 ras-related protein rab-32-like [Plasmopara halstedii]|eukprot:XP_024571467.1 ras-related protein rab-32-like [Plasmopara halstedii]
MNDRRVDAAQDAVIKVLVLGDAATGKTSIIKRYVYDAFSEHHRTTIGVDFALKPVTVNGTTIRMQLWDIAGQEHFRALNRVYYKDALGALLVYDMSRPETFDSILKWKKEIDSKVELPNGKLLPVILCGNKCDLKDEVDRTFLDEFCETNSFKGWFETSAKENIHIDDAAKALVTGILEHQEIFERKSNAKKRDDTFRPTSSANGVNASQFDWCCSSF